MDGGNGWTRYEKGKITFSLFEEGATFFFMTFLQPLLLLHDTDTTMRRFYSRAKVPTASSGRGMVINCCSCSVASKGWNYSFILCFYQGIRKLAMIILWDTGIENMFPGTPIYHLRRNNGREAKMRRPSCHYIDKRDDKH